MAACSVVVFHTRTEMEYWYIMDNIQLSGFVHSLRMICVRDFVCMGVYWQG